MAGLVVEQKGSGRSTGRSKVIGGGLTGERMEMTTTSGVKVPGIAFGVEGEKGGSSVGELGRNVVGGGKGKSRREKLLVRITSSREDLNR